VLASAQGVAVADDAASSFERMDAALQNAKDALGVMFSPAIAAIASALADSVNGVMTAVTGDVYVAGGLLEGVRQEAEKTRGALAMTGGQSPQLASQAAGFDTLAWAMEHASKAAAAGVPNAQSWANTLAFVARQAIQTGSISEQNTVVLGQLIAIMSQAGTATESTGQSMGTAAGKASVLASALSKVQQQAGATAGLIYNLGDAVDWLNKHTGAGGILNDSQTQLQGIAQMLVEQGNIKPEGVGSWLTGASAVMDDWLQAQQQAGVTGDALKVSAQAYLSTLRQSNTAIKTHNSALDAAKAAWNNINGLAGSALKQATSTDAIGGVNPGDYLPRADTASEDARRLADIMVKGFDSPWVGYFKDKFPKIWDEINQGGNIQQGAARVLEQFQQGFRPELLNFDQLKEQVKQQLLSQQAFEGMSKQITDQLTAEMGVSAQDVQGALNKVTGGGLPTGAAPVPDLTGQGNQAGQQFSAGFSASANGGTLVSAIMTQMVAAMGAFNANGRTAGQTWGAGFYASVSSGLAPQLIQLLVTLVTPQVLAAARVAQGQTQPQP
jgi:hypothetical protein